MSTVTLRFYEELNDHLPGERRKRDFIIACPGRGTVRDLIESLGVPHAEVDLILVNSESVDFTRIVHPGDRISVYPVFESLDIRGLTRLRPRPLRNTRFLLDTRLDRLARYLRLLGFDTRSRNNCREGEPGRITRAGSGRILLTRNRGLLNHRQVTRGYYVRGTDPREQLREIVSRFDLAASFRPFTRCVYCNGKLAPVAAASIRERVPKDILRTRDTFPLCGRCGRIYWRVSRYDRMRNLIVGLVNSV